MNSVNLIGRITKDPELKTSTGGKSYIAFTVAVNEFSGGNQYTQFIPCFAWEKTAENMAKYIKKGAQIAVEGGITVRQENSNGQYSTFISVRANRVHFLSSITQNNETNIAAPFQHQNAPNINVQNHLAEPTPPSNFDFDLIDDNTSSSDDSILWDD